MRDEIEEDRQRRLEETTRQIEQATAAGARRDPPRGREPLADRRREDHAQVADRRRPAAPDRRGALRDRLLAAGGEQLIAAAHRIYARALFDAATEQGPARRGPRPSSPTSRESLDEVPELDALLTNPETDSRVKADVLERVLGDADELVAQLRPAARREGPRRARSARSPPSSRRSSPRRRTSSTSS